MSFRDYQSRDFTEARSIASGTNEAGMVIPAAPANTQHRLRRLNAIGPQAASYIDVYIPRSAYYTTLKTAIAAGATAIQLNADDDGYIKGYQIQDADYLLIATDGKLDTQNVRNGWRLVKITSATEDAANDDVDLVVTGLDGITGCENAAAVGAPCYILPAAQAINYVAGTGGIEKKDVCSGEPGAPLAFVFDPTGAGGAHDWSVYGETY